jgi:hypothetical protein
VVYYAVVSDEIHQVIEFFRTPGEAEAMLESVLEDEPDWRETLYIECVSSLRADGTSTTPGFRGYRGLVLAVCHGQSH